MLVFSDIIKLWAITSQLNFQLLSDGQIEHFRGRQLFSISCQGNFEKVIYICLRSFVIQPNAFACPFCTRYKKRLLSFSCLLLLLLLLLNQREVLARTSGFLSFKDGHGNGNVAKQKVYWAEQWMCSCVIALGTFLCRPLPKKQREMTRFCVVRRTWTTMAKFSISIFYVSLCPRFNFVMVLTLRTKGK